MNTDKLTTWLGAAQSIGVAVIAWYTTENADGSVDWSSPVLYIGLSVAVLMAVKAIFTKGTTTPAQDQARGKATEAAPSAL